jgi:hypothetical protein
MWYRCNPTYIFSAESVLDRYFFWLPEALGIQI